MGYRGGYGSPPLTEHQQQIIEWQRRWAEAADLVGPEYADWIARHRELAGQTATGMPGLPPTGPGASSPPNGRIAPPLSVDWVTMEQVWR